MAVDWADGSPDRQAYRLTQTSPCSLHRGGLVRLGEPFSPREWLYPRTLLTLRRF